MKGKALRFRSDARRLRRLRSALTSATAVCGAPGLALAHTSENAIVLTLPSDLYILGGSLAVGLVYGGVLLAGGQPISELMGSLVWLMLAGLVLEGIGLYCHARDMQRRGGEGAAAHYRQRTTLGKTYRARNAGIVLSVVAVAIAALTAVEGVAALTEKQ